LVEVLSGEKCAGKYHRAPEKDIHKLENITIALEFLKKFVSVNVNSQDIMQGNLKVILSVVWRLILTFQVEGEETDETKEMSAAQRNKAAKLKLLKWCQDTTAGHKHVNIENFQNSWYDGMAFCALVHAMNPSLLDYDHLDPANAKENLTLAFELAEKHFDIPQLLDPADITAEDALSRPDEQCFMTYISAFPVAMLQWKLKQNEKGEAENIRRAEEEARIKAEEEAAKRIKEAEEAARRSALDEAARREAEAAARRKGEEEERERREKENLLAAEERIKREAREKAERKLAKEERRRAQEADELKRNAEKDLAKRAAEEEERERAFEEERERLRAENERLKASLLEAKGKLIGRVQITVIQARGLKSKVTAYVTLFCERQKERTRAVKKTKEPKWNAEFEFYVSEKDAQLELSLFDRHLVFADAFLGFISIPCSDLQDGAEVSEWYALKSRKNKNKSKIAGEVKLKILYRKEN